MSLVRCGVRKAVRCLTSDGDGLATESSVYGGGEGSEPQAVMQTFTTLGRAGGGGGGGGVTPGEDGEDDPTVANGPGLFGGTGGFGAAGGTAAPTPVVAAVLSDSQIRFQSDVFDDGTGNPDPGFVGHLLNPQIGQGQTFLIASVDALDTCSITAISTLAGDLLNLDSVPGLIPNSTSRITPPYNVGGAGGGGSGFHCGGAAKDAKGNEGYNPGADANPGVDDTDFYDDDNADILEDFSEEIFQLPVWIPGAGGGAGGGSLRMTVAGEVLVTSTGGIIADGGAGGESNGAGAIASSGGGGGGGGTIFVGTGNGISTSVGGQISARGGSGGAVGSGNAGGDGGNGRIRLENILGNMVPGDFVGVGSPTIAAENLGAFPGGGNSLGQSIFLAAGVLVPRYDRLEVTYNYVDGGNVVTGAKYIVRANGTVHPDSTLATPPFEIRLSFTEADPVTGLAVDPPPVALDRFVDPTDPGDELSAFDGLPYVRFQVVLDDPSNPAFAQTSVAIDSVEIQISGLKP